MELSFEELRRVLLNTPKEDLVDYLIDRASRDREVRQSLELTFYREDHRDELKKAIALINSSIDRYSDRHGFVSYENIDEALQGAEQVLSIGEKVYEKREYLHVVDLILAVIHELVGLLDSTDDDSGAIDYIMEESFQLLHRVVQEKELSLDSKRAIYDKIMREADNPLLDQWDEYREELLEKTGYLEK